MRAHWPEYLIEAWALGMFMISAGVFSTLLGVPGSPLQRIVPSEDLRRALVGVAMGLPLYKVVPEPVRVLLLNVTLAPNVFRMLKAPNVRLPLSVVPA